MTTTQLIHFAIAMVTITNPVGNLAIYAGLTGDRTRATRHLDRISGERRQTLRHRHHIQKIFLSLDLVNSWPLNCPDQ